LIKRKNTSEPDATRKSEPMGTAPADEVLHEVRHSAETVTQPVHAGVGPIDQQVDDNVWSIADEDVEVRDDAAGENEADEGETGTDDGEIAVEGVKSAQGDLAAEFADVQTKLLRTMADFDNFRRRSRQEKEDLQKFATRKLLEDLLPVVDNFDRALAVLRAGDSAAKGDVQAGIEMVHRQLSSVLQSYGVEAMDAVGQSFDPNLHEAVMQAADAEAAAGVILEEFQKGYRLHDRVLRPAMVKVSV